MNPPTLKELQKVIGYLKSHVGDRLTWGKVGKVIHMPSNRVVRTLKFLLRHGTITEPGGPGSQVYFIGETKSTRFNAPARLSQEEVENRRAAIKPVYHEHDDKVPHLRVKDHLWG